MSDVYTMGYDTARPNHTAHPVLETLGALVIVAALVAGIIAAVNAWHPRQGPVCNDAHGVTMECAGVVEQAPRDARVFTDGSWTLRADGIYDTGCIAGRACDD